MLGCLVVCYVSCCIMFFRCQSPCSSLHYITRICPLTCWIWIWIFFLLFSFFFGLPLSDSTARQSLTRPKSFVSTRLLSLEEAQARTQAPLLLQGSPHHAIGQFHTVLDLPADKWVSFHKSVTYKGMVNLQIKFFTFKYFKYFFLFLLGGKEGWRSGSQQAGAGRLFSPLENLELQVDVNPPGSPLCSSPLPLMQV